MTRNLTPLSAWAFSIGTSIGWGSLVVTSNTYLAKAGPWGSTFGTLIGGAIMIIIGINYAYMMDIYPEAGGAYTFSKHVFGHDYGFLTAWFLSLTYGHKTGDEWIRKTSDIICDFFIHSPVYRNGGDEFVVFLSERDYEIRHQLLNDLRDQSVRNISTQEAVISCGMSDYMKGKDSKVRFVFDRADAAMYEEKMRLKGLGARTGR